jgi:hypothetical protein
VRTVGQLYLEGQTLFAILPSDQYGRSLIERNDDATCCSQDKWAVWFIAF